MGEFVGKKALHWWMEVRNDRTLCRLLALRTIIIFSLIAGAAVCATVSYYLLGNAEHRQFQAQYDSISNSSEVLVAGRFERLHLGIREMATIYGYNFPSVESWPNCTWRGFYSTADLLKRGSGANGISFVPVVLPEQVAAYESYMKNYYENEPEYMSSQNSMFLPVGQIWSADPATGIPYHDTTGETTFSDLTILTPVAQYTYAPLDDFGLSGWNMHSDPRYGAVVDVIFDCASEHNFTYARQHCSAIAEPAAIPQQPGPEPVNDMVALFAHPIFPIDNTTQLVGFSVGTLSWRALLTDVIPSYVNSMEVVVEHTSAVFTFSITLGQAEYKGAGDLHDRNFDNEARMIHALDHDHILGAATYAVTLYPTKAFATDFYTDRPMWSAVGLIVIFTFCSLLFIGYDFLDQKEAGRKKAVLDTKRRFVRFISHEIRTPLNTVRLGMKLLEVELAKLTTDIKTTPISELQLTVQGYLESWTRLTDDVILNSETAVEVLNDLLNYDKIEMGTLKLEYAPVDLSRLLNKVVLVMQVQAEQKEVRLLVTEGTTELLAADNTAVIGDAQRLEQVVRNLIANALKFSPIGGVVTLAVKKSTSEKLTLPEKAEQALTGQSFQHRGTVTIAVKDSGAGLSEQELADIAAEGVQFNANELQAGQGSGLGLFISKGIVEQHGGRLVVTSEGPGKGATFSVMLPYTHCENQVKKVVSPTSTRNDSRTVATGGSSERTIGGARRMLVVDDSPFNRKMLIRLLSTKGHVCEQAEDGEVAIRKYTEMAMRNEAPDAILMDFEMPVMNGPTATAKLREMGCTCLIVGVTGNVLPADVAFFIEHGANAVLPKPLVLEDFEELLYRPQSVQRTPVPEVASMRVSHKESPNTGAVAVQGMTIKVHPLENV